jgi:hypothetical protein
MKTLGTCNELATKGQMLCDATAMKSLEWSNHRGREQNGGCQRLGEQWRARAVSCCGPLVTALPPSEDNGCPVFGSVSPSNTSTV